MSIDDTNQYDEPSGIKNAAELLTRGASLINEACPKCRGVQVKFKEIITCINCGNQQNVLNNVSSIDSKQQSVVEDSKRVPVEAIENKVTYKIIKLINILDEDNNEDISDQKKKAELLELYLRIIEKTRQLKNKADF
jgi:uncharacterized Zn finger protein (UPF0148 family)